MNMPYDIPLVNMPRSIHNPLKLVGSMYQFKMELNKMENIRNMALTFSANFAMAYFIFGEGMIGRPVLFALFMLMLMLGMDWYKSRGNHTLN